MARTGHVWGLWNNHFHLPVLAGLPAMPQFADDAFVQSLTGYASGFWQAFARHVPLEHASAFFLFWAVATRFATMLAFIALADLVGIERLRERLLFVTLIAFSSVLLDYSSAGGGGLFINYFTHSELANATIVATIGLTARRRYTAAMAMNGLTCFINAFMAVWALAPVAAIMLLQWRRGEADWRTIVGRSLLGAPIFLLLATPAIRALLAYWKPQAASFDYLAYVAEYAPVHYLVWDQRPTSLVMLAVVSAAGLLSGWLLARRDPRAAFLPVALIGSILLWSVGTILPLLTGSSTLLNLQLLRSGVTIHLLSGASLALLSVAWLGDAGVRARLWAPLLILGASLGRMLLPLSLLAMLLGRRPVGLGTRLRPDLIVSMLLAMLWPVQIVMQARFNAAAADQAAQWRAIGEWARMHSRPQDILLLPVATDINPTGPMRAADDQQAINGGSEIFQTAAERRVWVDFRAGGAVMWWPSFYPEWKRRMAEVLALPDHDARLAYARARGIAFLIDRCGGSGQVVLTAAPRCVYRVRPTTQSSRP